MGDLQQRVSILEKELEQELNLSDNDEENNSKIDEEK